MEEEVRINDAVMMETALIEVDDEAVEVERQDGLEEAPQVEAVEGEQIEQPAQLCDEARPPGEGVVMATNPRPRRNTRQPTYLKDFATNRLRTIMGRK